MSVLVLAGACALTVALSGCSNNAEESGPDPAKLVGNTYLSQNVTGPAIPGGGPLQVAFPTADTIVVSAGCNSLRGPVTFDRDSLTAGPLAATMMACPGERGQADAWVSGLFASPLTWSATADTLTLTRDDQTVELARRTDTPLLGTQWDVSSLLRNQAVETSRALEQAKPHLTIGDDGRVTGFGGCNNISGPAYLAEGVVRFGPMVTETEKSCGDEIDDVEYAVLAVLDGNVKYTIDGTDLSLTNEANPEIGLKLRAN